MIKVIELFSGIGSQTQALKNLNIQHEIVATSEWCINSIISYGEIHNPTPEYNLTREEILNELSNVTFSWDTKIPSNIKKLKDDKLKLLYKNHKNSKNLGSILDIKGENVPYCDLLTYSFPCTDISNQGTKSGLYEGKQSSLLWQVGRILDDINYKPSILLMENVAAILNDKHKDGLNEWIEKLKEKGYHSYIFKLKASYSNIPQNRERCFMVSSLKELNLDIKDIELTKLTINDILEDNVDEKYYLDKMLQFLPKNIKFNKTNNNIQSLDLIGYSNFTSEKKIYNPNGISPTITATGANSRVKIYKNGRIRSLTPKECWKLMGFKDEEFDKVKNLHSDIELIKEAGNSIVVNVLEKIFKEIYK